VSEISVAPSNSVERVTDTSGLCTLDQGKLAMQNRQAVSITKISNNCHNFDIARYLALEVNAMNVSLTPQLESYLKQKVAGGMYNSVSEVIREALRLQEKSAKAGRFTDLGVDRLDDGIANQSA
jgi:putative addiction module CopG family antidote